MYEKNKHIENVASLKYKEEFETIYGIISTYNILGG